MGAFPFGLSVVKSGVTRLLTFFARLGAATYKFSRPVGIAFYAVLLQRSLDGK